MTFDCISRSFIMTFDCICRSVESDGATSDPSTEQQRLAAAQVFRGRRHISQEDTLSLGSMEDLSNAIARVEQPAQV